MLNNIHENHDNSLAIVIVTFNPDIKKMQSLVSVLKDKCSHIYIIDNNSGNSLALLQFFEDQLNATLILNNLNLGIAAAQNKGIKASIESGYKFTLLFDQDSLPEDTFISNLIKGFYSLDNFERVSAVGPKLFDSRYKFNYSFIILDSIGRREKYTPNNDEKEPVEVTCLIASGMLINNNCLNAVGLMNEDLFIDYVDTEWCLRCKSFGYSLFLIPQAKLEHEIGDSSIKFFKYRIPVHSPWRRYYRVRNGFSLLKMKHVPKLLSIREIIFSFVHQIVLWVNTRDSKYLKYYLKSVKDAFRTS